MTLLSGPPPGSKAHGDRDAHALAVLLLAAALGVGTVLRLVGPGHADLPQPTHGPLSGVPSPHPADGSNRPSLQALQPPGAAPTGSQSATAGSLNVNTADVETLQAMPGIGPTLAKRIVAHRLEHGPFQTVEDLLQVPGLGPKRWERIRHTIRVVAEEP